VLEAVEVVAGYGTYIDLLKPLVAEKEIIQTGMTKEVARVTAAVETAQGGKAVALVSSGDPGIYAMAGLALEICSARKMTLLPVDSYGADRKTPKDALYVEMVPGIPALCSGGALLGAPLTVDFAAISLSDLLTPWEVIEKRITAAAQADFVMVIYNPKSKKRHWQLQKTQEIVLGFRDDQTPVGIATSVMRPEQKITLTTLAELHKADVNMQSTVFIGNSNTETFGSFMFTPRGYKAKYALK
jgi:precorrin-3B C17-methyltransferase